MQQDLEKLVNAGKIDRITAEKLDKMPPGNYCLHNSWGPGKVTEWDRLNLKVIIDFEEKPGHALGMKFAASSLCEISRDSFLARRHSQLKDIQTLAEEDPVALVKTILSENGGSLRLDALENLLKGRVISEGKYKGWWEATKKKLREDRLFVVPSKRNEPLELRATGADPCLILIAEYENSRDLRAKVKAVEHIIKDLHLFDKNLDNLQKLGGTITEDGRRGVKIQFVPSIELIIARDEMISKTKELLPEESWTSLAQILGEQDDQKLGELLESVSLHKVRQILKEFSVAYGDRWVEKMLGLIQCTNLRTISEIGNFLFDEGKGRELMEFLENGLNQRLLTSDALAWICRERTRHSEMLFDPQLSLAVMSSLETDQLKDEGAVRSANRLRDLITEDRNLIPDLIKDAGMHTLRNFASRLVSSASFDELTRKSLMARVIKLHPEVQDLISGREVTEEILFVTEESLQQRKAAYDKLVKEEIPSNREDIKIAKEYGDLRENFEFKSAKEYQRVLMRKRADWERDLRLAQPYDFSNPDISKVSLGTTVSLVSEEGEEPLTYSIMGAWDSDPEKGTIAYLSERGNLLLEKKVGESVTLPTPTGGTVKYKVSSIEPFKR